MSRPTLIAAYLVLLSALAGLGWFGRDRLLARYFARQCLEHPDWRQRANAALTLADLGAPGAVPVLEAARNDAMAPVRLNAGWALHRLTKRECGGDPKGPLGLLPPWERPNLESTPEEGSPDAPSSAPREQFGGRPGTAKIFPLPALKGVSLALAIDNTLPRLTIPEEAITATISLTNRLAKAIELSDGANWYRAARYDPNGVVEPVAMRGARPALVWIRIVRREFTPAGTRASTTTHVVRFEGIRLESGATARTTFTLALTGAQDPAVQMETLTWTAILEPLDVGGSGRLGVVPPATVSIVAVRGDNPGLTALSTGERYVIVEAIESDKVRFERALPVYATGYTWETNDDGSGRFGTDATASGRPANAGANTLDRPRTLATDWSQFPRDTLCYVSGLGWGRVEDKCGAAVRDRERGADLPRVDCYLGRFGSRAEAEAAERAMTGVRGCVVVRPAAR